MPHRSPLREIAATAALLSLTLTLSTGCATARRTPADGVIEADQFADLLDASDSNRLAVIDVRTVPQFDAGHVSNAVRADPNDWKDRTLAKKSGIEDKQRWRSEFGRLGITGRDPVVVYDDGRMTEAARIWFLLQLLGARDVAVLNGGYPTLQLLIDAGRVPTARAPMTIVVAKFDPPSNSKTAVELVDREQTRAAVQSHSAQIFDSRTREEYTGKDMRKNPRGGHLPTALSLPHKSLLDADGRLKSPAELASIFEQAGFKRGEPIIVHCESGGRASLAALAAVRAGFGPVANYYRSFGDWSAEASCPVESGD